ncbi:AAA family ATPase [Pedobacter sp. D749]|uniref:AAA family ATPase n=1 Tax=Pedobacter sp. D749 TaxID=2856523 RepID=UPI001C563500|nr:AAA family ATPase [Pedobacter sp. D749]QXU39998.1 AAA family ATPase [Pedobacter sp. D749]
MKIKSLIIEDLFDIFHYDISFKSNENVFIITGPNGFGKTMVLNIINNLFNRKFLFFQKLVFKKISFFLESSISIILDRKIKDSQQEITISFFQENKLIDTINFSNKLEVDIERSIQRYLPIRRISDNKWIDLRTDESYSSRSELVEKYAEYLPDDVKGKIHKISSPLVNDILDSVKVYLIKEQRLFIKSSLKTGMHRDESDQQVMVETIQTYAKELKLLINEFTQKSFKRSQELDSSYPNRLINEKNILNKNEYEIRYNSLKKKQDKLTKLGLYESTQEFLAYSANDAKALSVYIKDYESKLGVFDELLEKIVLFSNILNERRFTFKTIGINRDQGFFFKTSKNSDLRLNDLSSGEQHEVVLLYELIFNVNKKAVILIDEPEISLHITWQKEFLNDLIKIVGNKDVQVLIATHSPAIINNRWDLVHNLETAE